MRCGAWTYFVLIIVTCQKMTENHRLNPSHCKSFHCCKSKPDLISEVIFISKAERLHRCLHQSYLFAASRNRTLPRSRPMRRQVRLCSSWGARERKLSILTTRATSSRCGRLYASEVKHMQTRKVLKVWTDPVKEQSKWETLLNRTFSIILQF